MINGHRIFVIIGVPEKGKTFHPRGKWRNICTLGFLKVGAIGGGRRKLGNNANSCELGRLSLSQIFISTVLSMGIQTASIFRDRPGKTDPRPICCTFF